MSDCVVVFITAPSKDKAEALGTGLVEGRLAACVNIIPSVSSIYVWEGKLCKEEEALMVIKSTSSLFPALSTYVRENHDYEVPEIIALPISEGLKDYLDWIREASSLPPSP